MYRLLILQLHTSTDSIVLYSVSVGSECAEYLFDQYQCMKVRVKHS